MDMRLALKILVGVTGYGVWAFMAWADPSQRPDFLKFNIALATGTVGLVLRDMPSAPAPTQPAAPTGYLVPPGPPFTYPPTPPKP